MRLPAGCSRPRSAVVASVLLLLLSASIDIASAQLPARVETPYTQMDAESDLVVGYGYGIDAPRGRSFGGQEFDAQFELKW